MKIAIELSAPKLNFRTAIFNQPPYWIFKITLKVTILQEIQQLESFGSHFETAAILDFLNFNSSSKESKFESKVV